MNSVHNPSHYLLKFYFNILLPSLLRCEKWYLPWSFCDQNSVYISAFFLMCYAPCPAHTLPYKHPNNPWQRVRIMKLLIMQFGNTHPWYHHFPKHPVSILSLAWETFTPLQNKLQNYSSAFFNHQMCKLQTREQNVTQMNGSRHPWL